MYKAGKTSKRKVSGWLCGLLLACLPHVCMAQEENEEGMADTASSLCPALPWPKRLQAEAVARLIDQDGEPRSLRLYWNRDAAQGTDTISIKDSTSHQTLQLVLSPHKNEWRMLPAGAYRLLAIHHFREPIFRTHLRLEDIAIATGHRPLHCLAQKNGSRFVAPQGSALWPRLEIVPQFPPDSILFYSWGSKPIRKIIINTSTTHNELWTPSSLVFTEQGQTWSLVVERFQDKEPTPPASNPILEDTLFQRPYLWNN